MDNIFVIHEENCTTGSANMQHEHDISSESETENYPEKVAAREAMYRIVFGSSQKKQEMNVVDSKIEQIIRKSRIDVMKTINQNDKVTETRDDFHLSGQSSPDQVIKPCVMARSKSFDNLGSDDMMS